MNDEKMKEFQILLEEKLCILNLIEMFDNLKNNNKNIRLDFIFKNWKNYSSTKTLINFNLEFLKECQREIDQKIKKIEGLKY